MDGGRIERDPTMDNRIVHAVCVFNKKEQCQLKDRERNLQNEFDVEQHIIRREEKSLLKQFQKLQLEKYHRHGNEVHSPQSPTSYRKRSPHDSILGRSRHSFHRGGSPMKSPMTSGHHLQSQQITQEQSSHASMNKSYPSSSLISNYAFSHVPSGYSLQTTYTDGSLPKIDSRLRRSISQECKKRGKELDDGRHHNRLQRYNNEIESMVESYMTPRQPAGYGHSIKDISDHKDLYRYGVQKDKHKHRRNPLDFDYPGNYCHVGNLHLLNDVGPYTSSSHSKLSTSYLENNMADETMKKSLHDCQPNNKENSFINLRSRRSTADTVTHGLHSTIHACESTIPENEAFGREKKEAKPRNLEITVVISRKNAQKDKRAHSKLTHVTTTVPTDDQVSGIDDTISEKKPSTSSSYQTNHAPSSQTEIRGSRVPVPNITYTHCDSNEDFEQHPPETIPFQTSTTSNYKQRIHGAKVQETGTNHRSHESEVAADTLAELEALCGSSTQGYFNQSGFGNRRSRFKQLVKELLMKQMPAAARKRQLAAFDPLASLQCRYLRLSPSNIEELIAACNESGIDVQLHPHSNVTDICEYVFGKNSEL